MMATVLENPSKAASELKSYQDGQQMEMTVMTVIQRFTLEPQNWPMTVSPMAVLVKI